MAQKSITYKRHTFDISYEIVNPKAKIDALFLHGWGSKKELMKQAFGNYLNSFRHIYVDLPGFGNSTAPIVLDTHDYARIIELFLLEINGQKEVVVGHSFGGKVATFLEPNLLVLLSSAGIYRKKPLKVQVKIMLFKMLKSVGLSRLRELFVAEDAKKLSKQMYETFKRVVNEDMRDIFAHFEQKALICWGDKDSATPLEDGLTIAKLIPNAKFIEYSGDHYFFLHHAKNITKQIEQNYLQALQEE